ncbi:dicarboxylate/amino acid:cation symporter [candidate division KSB1 bacterium]
MKWWFRQSLNIQILISIICGVLLGVLLGEHVGVIKPIGDIFLRLLKMLVVPLVFFTIADSVISMSDLRTVRLLGGSALLYFVSTSVLAVVAGLAITAMLRPGTQSISGLDTGTLEQAGEFNILDNIVQWFPANPVEAFAQGNILQIIVFAVIVGIAVILMHKKSGNLRSIIKEGAELMMVITNIIMKFAPYGICVLIADLVVSLDRSLISDVGMFVIAFYTGIAFLFVVVYPLLIKVFAKRNPLQFYRDISPALFVAASTTSSAATLPVSMKVAEENLGIPKKVWGFTLPFGLTFNMDGSAVVFSTIALFAAYLHNFDVSFAFVIQAVMICFVLSVANAGIKGGGIVMSTILLQSLNLPLTLVPVLAAIWPVLDIGTTTGNITGDLVGTAIIGRKTDKTGSK